MKKYIAVILISLSTWSAFGATTPSLNEFFENELYEVQELMNQAQSTPDNYVYKLSKIRFRVRGKAGLEVPFLAKLEIRPFIEFHFTN